MAGGLTVAPLPSTRVVHAQWAAHHRPTALGTLTATCMITTSTGGGWSPTTGPNPGTTTILYDGPCAVTDLARAAQARDAAGQAVIEHPYAVAIDPAAAAIPDGAIITVTACTDDPTMVGLHLRVAATSHDSLMLERVLTCDLDTTAA